MTLEVPPGKYILAVSGGVDSMTLLDILSQRENLELVVAHFNHGIRENSSDDEVLVRQKAITYGLPFEAGSGNLGPDASEAAARQARYEFFNQIKRKYEANNIITAHHQDDLIETALINIIRGTGPKGLIAISANKNVLRPLLNYPKTEIMAYAQANSLQWLEDATNQDNKHLRNHIRNILMPKMSLSERQHILTQIEKVQALQVETEEAIANLSQKLLINEWTLSRAGFIRLPSEIAAKFLIFWLRKQGVKNLDRKTVRRLVNSLKTAPAGSRHEVGKGKQLSLSKKQALLTVN